MGMFETIGLNGPFGTLTPNRYPTPTPRPPPARFSLMRNAKSADESVFRSTESAGGARGERRAGGWGRKDKEGEKRRAVGGERGGEGLDKEKKEEGEDKGGGGNRMMRRGKSR